MASTTKDLGRVMPVAQGAYSATKAYTPLDIVSYNGGSYICLAANTGKAPTDMTCWQSLAMPGADGAQGPAGNKVMISNWSNIGVVYLNGFTADTDDIHYRTIDIDKNHTIEIRGSMKTPNLKGEQQVTAFRLPLSIMGSGQLISFNNVCWWGDRWAKVDINPTTGDLNLTDMDSYGNTPAASIMTNLRFSW